MMSRRRALILANQIILPSDYQRVEWIGTKSSGIFGINTNYATTGRGIAVETTISCNNLSGEQEIVGRNGSGGFCMLIYSSKFGIYDGRSATYVQHTLSTGVKYRVRVKCLPTSLYAALDDEESYRSVTSIDYPLQYLTIFQHNGGYTFRGKIYDQLKIWDNDVLVRYYVPCYRKSDSVIGMYDLCGSISPITNSAFYVNIKNTVFEKGADV